MIKLKIKKKDVTSYLVDATWSGSDSQASRELSFQLVRNAYDKSFKNVNVSCGDLVKFYVDKALVFVGVVTRREMKGEAGPAAYVAKDFMHYLLRSKGSFVFRNTTPELAAERICRQIGVSIGSLAKTGIHIAKGIYDEVELYNIIIGMYRKAYRKNGKKYMPIMDGRKFCVVTKGEYSGVTLKTGEGGTITSSSYTEDTDSVVNRVAIYDDKRRQVGEVSNAASQKKYGVYQDTYKKEKGVNAKEEAKRQLMGASRELKLEAVGNVKCTSGRSVVVRDTATKMKGTYYISSDSHKWSNGLHTMSLTLTKRLQMEAV